MARQINFDSGRFELKATPDELRAWAAAAEAEDRPLGSWLRALANRAADLAADYRGEIKAPNEIVIPPEYVDAWRKATAPKRQKRRARKPAVK